MLLLVCALSCACHCCRATRALTILPGTGWVRDNSRICHCAGRSAWQSTGGRGTLLCRWPTAACSSKDMTRVTHIHSAYVDSIRWLQDVCQHTACAAAAEELASAPRYGLAASWSCPNSCQTRDSHSKVHADLLDEDCVLQAVAALCVWIHALLYAG